MKQDELMDAIGNVDDRILAECDHFAQHHRIPTLWKAVAAVAAAALMTLSAYAATKLLSRPINGGGVVTDGTITPVRFIGGDIVLEPQVGLKVVMETDMDSDAPTHLEEIYYLTMPEEWTGSPRAWAKSKYLYSSMEYVWRTEGKAGEVRFSQEPGSNYSRNDHVVDYLNELPLDTAVKTKIIQLADHEFLQVYIPPVKLDGYVDQNVAYFEGGEYRLYWTDGRYLFSLHYPSWLTETEVEQILLGIGYKRFVPEYPDGYGTIVLERIRSMVPNLEICRGNTGTTALNNATSMGNAIYRDGMFYFSEPERIVIYDSTSKEQEAVTVKNDLFPTYMFLGEDHLLFADSWQEDLYAMNLKTKEVEVVYQGLGNEGLYADGMILYALHENTLQQIDLLTGEVKELAVNIGWFTMDENRIVAIPKSGNAFLMADRANMVFKQHSLSFRPSENIILNGGDIYLSVATDSAGENLRQLIKWSNGVETPMNVACDNGQFVGKVLYYLEDNTLKSYNTETGQSAVLFENCGDLAIHENQYLTVQFVNNKGRAVLDLETGETSHIDYPNP